MSGLAVEPILLPGGVADPGGLLGFLESPGGGIDAVDLATGETLWQSREAALPLLADGDELIAATRAGPGEIRIAVLAARDGGRRRPPSAVLGLGSPSWSLTAVRRQGDELRLAWVAQPVVEPHGGQDRPDEPAPEPAVAKEARVDLRSGRVESLPAGSVAAAPPSSWPGWEKLELMPRATGGAGPWSAGDRQALLALEPGPQGSRLMLHTRSLAAGKAGAPAELLPRVPAAGYLQHYLFPDRRHAYLLLCNDREENGAPPGSSCRWLAFSVEDGRRVAELPHPPGLEMPLAILGPRLFYALVADGPRILRAIDLKTSRLLWQREIAGGPPPPLDLP